MGFLKLIVQIFFVCVELSWWRRVGPRGPKKLGFEGWGFEGWGFEGWGPEVWGPNPEKVGARRVGARRVGARRVRGPKFRAVFPLPPQCSFFSSLSWGVFSWNFGGV